MGGLWVEGCRIVLSYFTLLSITRADVDLPKFNSFFPNLKESCSQASVESSNQLLCVCCFDYYSANFIGNKLLVVLVFQCIYSSICWEWSQPVFLFPFSFYLLFLLLFDAQCIKCFFGFIFSSNFLLWSFMKRARLWIRLESDFASLLGLGSKHWHLLSLLETFVSVSSCCAIVRCFDFYCVTQSKSAAESVRRFRVSLSIFASLSRWDGFLPRP